MPTEFFSRNHIREKSTLSSADVVPDRIDQIINRLVTCDRSLALLKDRIKVKNMAPWHSTLRSHHVSSVAKLS